MCGRFGFTLPPAKAMAAFGLDEAMDYEPRANIAPGTDILAIVRGEENKRLPRLFHWGLVPAWAKDRDIGRRLINARAETAAEKPAWRDSLRKRRCLIPAERFYEWRRTGDRKEPFALSLRSHEPFAMAGLWAVWRDPAQPEAAPLFSCAILTTAANALIAPIHDRMPVILAPEAHAGWLDPTTPLHALTPLLVPFPAEAMDARPVNPRVNNPANQDI